MPTGSGERGKAGEAAADRDPAAVALVLGVAATAWFGWAQEGPPKAWVLPLAVGSGAAAVLAVLGGIATWRRRRGSSAMRDPAGRRLYGIVVGVETALIVAGVVVLAVAGDQRSLSAWILLVVGAHFLPLGRLFRSTALRLCGLVCCLVAVAAWSAGSAGTLLPSAVAGAGGGVAMLLAGLVDLLRARRTSGVLQP